MEGFRCVCFSEAPISKLAYILANPMPHGMRYQSFGIMFEKRWVFENGGRPVIYQKPEEYDLLLDEQKYRHVTYEPDREKSIDFTWEREWRVHKDELQLDPKSTTVIIPNRSWEDYMISRYKISHGQNRLCNIYRPIF